jgi:hypothetical protein
MAADTNVAGMSIDDVRRLFEITVPAALASTRPMHEGFRCRFHVEPAGAWEIDLRPPAPTCVDAHTAGGGYHAVITLSADDLIRLTSTGAVSPDAIATTGDRERARTMLSVLAKGPPFEWPTSLRVMPVQSAIFSAAEAELARAFPGWVPRLAVPRRVAVRNPFNGTMGEELVAWPELERLPSFVPLAPPFAFAFLPLAGDWWEDLIDFHLRIVPDDAAARALREDEPLDLWEATARLFPQVLFGGSDRPSICAVPTSLGRAIANLSDVRCDELAAEIARPKGPLTRTNPFTGVLQDFSKQQRELEAHAQRGLRELRDLAMRALVADMPIWFWGWFE